MTTQLVSRAEAGLRPPRHVNGPAPAVGLTGHYEGNSPWNWVPGEDLYAKANHDRCASIWRANQAQHMSDPAAADIYYSSGVCPHGSRYEGRGPGVRQGANGTNDGNTVSYTVCYIAGDDDPLTDAAKWALLDEQDRFGLEFKWPHSHWYATACCGNPFRDWIAAGCPVPNSTPPGSNPLPVIPPEVAQKMASAQATNGEDRVEWFSVNEKGQITTSWQQQANTLNVTNWTVLGSNPPPVTFVDVSASTSNDGRIVVTAYTMFGTRWEIWQLKGDAGGYKWDNWVEIKPS